MDSDGPQFWRNTGDGGKQQVTNLVPRSQDCYACMMLCYRYRQSSALSFKELRYQELFFASRKELNDPFDAQRQLFFEPDNQKWQKLLQRAWRKLNGLPPQLSETTAELLAKKGPLPVLDLLTDESRDQLVSHLCTSLNIVAATLAVQAFQGLLRCYGDDNVYVVSFSSHNTSTVMWSHYAGSHRGFCLIFRTESGVIRQDPSRTKDYLDLPGVRTSIPRSFEMREVRYGNLDKAHSAFLSFPSDIAGKLPFSENDKQARLAFHQARDALFLRKETTWEYEREMRLLLQGPSAWLSGPCDLTPEDRVFHYDLDQLVGVIFGMAMSPEDKNRTARVISSLRKEREHQQRVGKRQPFIFFQAEASYGEGKLRVKPVQLIERCCWKTQSFKPGESVSEKTLEQWNRGEALDFRAEGGASRVLIE